MVRTKDRQDWKAFRAPGPFLPDSVCDRQIARVTRELTSQMTKELGHRRPEEDLDQRSSPTRMPSASPER